MKAILIDDEVHCITTLSWAIKEYCPELEIVATGCNGVEGIKLIRDHKPDVVFLDIEMPILNGLDMLNAIENIDFKVIFTTAYNQYAVRAIKLSATDYLLKPIDKDELMIAVKKLSAEFSEHDEKNKINTLKHNLGVVPGLHKVVVPTDDGILFFDLVNIVHLEADSNYTMIYFDDLTKIISSRVLKDFEDLLPKEQFFRCHRSHIINLNFIQKYIKGEGGSIVLKNGKMIELSRRKKADFLEIIGM